MYQRTLRAACLLALLVPSLAAAQSMEQNRAGSWEFSLGGGAQWLDAALRDFLGSGAVESRFANDASPSLLVPTAMARIGYNVNENFGFSVGGAGGMGAGVRYINPTASATYTINLNAKTSPFLMIGTEFMRLEGENDRLTHSTWGAHAGLGIRHMIGDNVALRLDGSMRLHHYQDIPMERSTTYSPLAILGLSFFTGGRAAPMVAMMAPPRMTRVDTVRIVRVDTVRMAAPPQVQYVCEHGVAPAGAPVDRYGCLIFADSLLLEGVNFAFDKSELSPTAHSILDRVAESMIARPELYFEIAGHTDDVGTLAYNYLLSARRAAAVRNYLIGRNVPAGHMTAVGYGEEFPIAPNETIEGRALNRRGIQLRVRKP